MTNVDELKSQLVEYNEQLEGIEALLQEEPENEEYVAMKESTKELISDLEALLAAAASPSPKPALTLDTTPSVGDGTPATDDSSSTAGTVSAENQVSAALERGLYVGLPCEAVWPDDGLWYPALIESINAAGIKVKFKSYGDVLTLEAVKVRPAGVATEKKRKEPTGGSEEPESADQGIPEHLRYADTDTEKTREWKKRQQKAWKSERRRERQQEKEIKSKVSWQNFSQNLKKTGLGTRKESMFRTSEGHSGKVGVIGSGKGMTKQPTAPNAPAARHTSYSPHPETPQQSYDPLAAPSYYIPHAQPRH